MPTELDKNVRAAARRNEQRVLQHMGATKQVELAESLGVHESTVSRMKDAEIARFSLMLALLNLKIVPTNARMYDPQVVAALTLLAKDNLSRATTDDWVLDE